MTRIHEIRHPLIQHHLTKLRDKDTPSGRFRRSVYRLTFLLAYEATRDFPIEPLEVETPLTKTTGACIARRVGLFPILRAGLGMVDPVLSLIPLAQIWHLGFYRNEETLEPVPYYEKLSGAPTVDIALVLDPMLATGGSAVAAIQSIRDWGVQDIRLLSLIAAPEGIDKVLNTHDNVNIYVCSIDDKLNDRGYILPGLGDAGDRIFNTVASQPSSGQNT
jgi:uracil phosphoribosyltransferase